MKVMVFGRTKVAFLEAAGTGFEMTIEGVPGRHYCKTAEPLKKAAELFGAVVVEGSAK